nr:HAD hydrolase-like protein [uncultured Agathobaculum sp.]
MYQYILFDLDGTLTDPREGITKSVQYALAKMGIEEPDLSALEHFIGPPLYDEFRRCYNFDDAQAKQAVAAYRERFSVHGWKENILFDGVPAMLQTLRDAGKTLAVASSKPTVFVEKILDLFEIAPYFDAVSGATLDGSISTKAQVVEQALALLSVEDHKSVVLVGDRMHDVEGAQLCSIDCVGVTFGFGGLRELQQAGAKHVVQDFSELIRLLTD